MILGGGYYQLPLIRKSVELGYYTIVCGIAGNYPGYQYASKWVDVDTFDKNAVLTVAQQEKIDGILLCGSDACMPTIGYVCDKMNLIGPSEQATINASNKAIMKELFVANGVRTARYKKIESLEEAKAFSEEHGFPIVLKVVDASGSKGVIIVKDENLLSSSFSSVIKETKLPYIIIEEFVDGKEFGAQSFVRNGVLTFVMPHGDVVYHGVTDIPIGHYAPYEKEQEILPDAIEQLNLCVRALGINNTAINADFILSKGKVYVLEIGARAGATCLPELVSNHFSMDYYEYLLRQCLGDSISFTCQSRENCLVETLISKQTGIVDCIEIGELPREAVSFTLYPQKGDFVHSFRNAWDRIGTLVLKGEELSQLFAMSDDIKSNLIKIRLV